MVVREVVARDARELQEGQLLVIGVTQGRVSGRRAGRSRCSGGG